jgi:hypothetical protein
MRNGDNLDDHVFVGGSKGEKDEAILNDRLLELALEGKSGDLIHFRKSI